MGEDDSDSLRAIIRIPTGPLLHYLESREADSGIESGSQSGTRRDTLGSNDTRYSSDVASSINEDAVGGAELLALPAKLDGNRCSSFHSETSESSSGGRSIMRWVWSIC